MKVYSKKEVLAGMRLRPDDRVLVVRREQERKEATPPFESPAELTRFVVWDLGTSNEDTIIYSNQYEINDYGDGIDRAFEAHTASSKFTELFEMVRRNAFPTKREKEKDAK
jgi:hypothetical protein